MGIFKPRAVFFSLLVQHRADYGLDLGGGLQVHLLNNNNPLFHSGRSRPEQLSDLPETTECTGIKDGIKIEGLGGCFSLAALQGSHCSFALGVLLCDPRDSAVKSECPKWDGRRLFSHKT